MGEERCFRRQELEVLDTLKAALQLYLHNFNFIVFTLFTSIPLFTLSVYYEIIVHKTLYEVSESFGGTLAHSYDLDRPRLVSFAETLPKIIRVFLLYLVPYHLVDLFSLVLTVDAASDLIGAEEEPASLKNVTLKALKKARFRGPFITSLYVHLFSICTFIGLMWLVVNHQVLLKVVFSSPYWERGYFGEAWLGIVHGVAFMALLMKYMDWSAEWNMGLVVSILEDSYGSEAMEVAAYLSKGNNKKGALLMLVFFLWGLCLRLPCLYGKCSERNGGVLVISVGMCLVCVGNVFKWTTCLLYFNECKKRVMEKKFDEEEGKGVVQAMVQEKTRVVHSEAEAVGSA
ncbi:uncharacterized protein LOC104435639 [Eucalyptus grandis]|uniref:uncharacterized protein LOC104435639 n=1 Tax=Eucalyptus grandis TaxID=71139 RepID=UPI00192EA210|nr:uncharacterized protein LOC104435639 [Eucalyptus grandis]